ncbi:MAG: hypothetical protein E7385_00415 [Ruminococcaceae bacterium]|nr:hypothetical protein [Oscillospiraceae bacterium]
MKRLRRMVFSMALLALSVLLLVSCAKDSTSNPPKTSDTPTKDLNAEFTDTISGVQADENKFMNISIVDEGVDIYAYEEGQTWGYRYGPSMINYADGTMDAWFAAPGACGPWDYFTYRHSDDGVSWSDEKVVLQPLPETMDYASVCDPGLVYFGGYYYMGYTSTIHNGGVCNNGFVARSKNPDGPYEKWNGSGWGGEPAPIVYYTDDGSAWGAGEMSFVEVDGTLYIYYTWKTPNSNTTRVSIADSTKENWPATMQYKGIAMEYNMADNEDSADVKYVEDYGKFIAINTTKRMGPDSAIQIWESNDGITFYRTNTLKTNIIYYCHNAGFMSRPNGHINLNDKLYLGYAYGGTSNDWGKWSTRLHEFKITLGDAIDTSDAQKPNRKVDVEHWTRDHEWNVAIATNSLQHYEKYLSQGKFDIELFTVDTTFKTTKLTDSKGVVFSDYDTSLISFKGFTCTPKKTGSTYVTVTYDGLSHIFKVTILDDEGIVNSAYPLMVEFKSALTYAYDGPVKINEDGSVTMYVSNRKEKVQLRAMARFDDRNFMEISNGVGEFFDGKRYIYDITYTSSDENIVRVAKNGVVSARKVGTATVTVKCGDFSYDVKITVV